jgi:hypothetical protein
MNIGFLNFNKGLAIVTGLLESHSASKSNESTGGMGLN